MRIIVFLITTGIFSISASYNWNNAPSPKENSCLFSFVQITDTHCLKVDKKSEKPPAKAFFQIGGYKFHWLDYVNSFPILEKTIEYINSQIKPDFVIHTGDISDRGDLSNLTRAKVLLDRLNCPYYPVMGDHDLGGYSYSNFNRFDCNYIKVFGQRNYSFNYQDWHIIILGIYPDDEELNWLRKDLSENAEKPIILATHRLVIADEFTLWLAKKHLGVELLMPRAEEVLKILKEYSNIKLVLSGHCHSNFRWKRSGIDFISTAALSEVPHQFKLFQVYPDKITMTLFTADTAEDIFNKRWISQYSAVIKLREE